MTTLSPSSEKHPASPVPSSQPLHQTSDTLHNPTAAPFTTPASTHPQNQHDQEKSLPHLTPVPSSTSTVEQAIDAEAGLANEAASGTGPAGVTKVESAIGPPPNGGFHAWLQVAGSFFLFFNCWVSTITEEQATGHTTHGPLSCDKLYRPRRSHMMLTVGMNAFGVFQTYYLSDANTDWKETPSNISWIGSIQAFLLLLVGVLTGPLYDAGYFRQLIITGAVLIPLGFMMTSLTHTYWQVMLAQAFLIGLGNGCVFVPSVAILPQYFTTRRALANGLAASGSSIGGIVYPIAFRNLQQSVGFPWASRVLGFIAFATLSFSVCVMKPRIRPQGRRALVDLSAFKDVPYLIFCFAMFLAFIGFYGPIFYIQPYAIENNLTSTDFAFYLLPILNAASVPGRILPNFLADYAGPLNILVPCAILTGVLALCWIGIHNIAGLIVFGILYGFFSGGFVSMPPVAITSLTPDMRRLGTRMGQCFFFSAFGLLCGTPVSGAILRSTGSWLGVQLFSGVTIFLTGVLLVWARVASKGWDVRVKV